jgi:hypothetical protein
LRKYLQHARQPAAAGANRRLLPHGCPEMSARHSALRWQRAFATGSSLPAANCAIFGPFPCPQRCGLARLCREETQSRSV